MKTNTSKITLIIAFVMMISFVLSLMSCGSSKNDGSSETTQGQIFSEFPYEGGTYSGYAINGVPNGYGKLTQTNGAVYEGDFVNGNREGKGKYTSADGKVSDGKWSNNEFLG